ncbi:uncharacterized protein LY89DRAFT_730158 [Mollisia scopiformis]|uniref:DUF7587 domain-containing protein n=1 Tax=Mollisia scopiformis TaxID=149040 RepID=A0A194XMJ1_MOLSC|nr:uncharacterized protein LY89DRAFT_730158 [Mollisia scopiformis]KUJ21378.1 hypothetical protein LY89DRAFT_730158 [Mollisia scopiformis]
MDFPWTSPADFPRELWRVLHAKQETKSNGMGLVAGAPWLRLPFQTNLAAFTGSIMAHRNQDRLLSPYISFFEDKAEAEQWCLAAEEYLHETTHIIQFVINDDMLQALSMGTFRAFRVKDVARQLGLEDSILGYGSERGFSDSEFMWLGAAPVTNFFVVESSKDIRQRKQKEMYPILNLDGETKCKCELDGRAKVGETHLCVTKYDCRSTDVNMWMYR